MSYWLPLPLRTFGAIFIPCATGARRHGQSLPPEVCREQVSAAGWTLRTTAASEPLLRPQDSSCGPITSNCMCSSIMQVGRRCHADACRQGPSGRLVVPM